MENIREARKRRLDPSPPTRADADGKDW
jgi:hypothetical protein